MTLPTSGALSMSQINAEFGRGTNLNSYRGTTWYTDAGASGTFSSGTISMSEFYGKRLTSPESYSQHTFVSASSIFTYGYFRSTTCLGEEDVGGQGSFSPATYRSMPVYAFYRNKGNNDLSFILCGNRANADSTFKRIEIVGVATYQRTGAKNYYYDSYSDSTGWVWGLATLQTGTWTVRIYY